MLSEMAARDIDYLIGKGIALTPAQIVELNRLALRAEHGAESSALVEAPRVAWAGSTAIYEPTIQVMCWLRDFGEIWWHGASLSLAVAWACAHARKIGFFENWSDERATRREIERWQRGLDCTLRQLDKAVDYAANGIPDQPDQVVEGAPHPAPQDGCPYADVVAEAVAAGLGISVAELSVTPRRLVADWLMRWTKNSVALAGGKADSVRTSSATRDYCAYDDYLQTLDKEPAADVQG